MSEDGSNWLTVKQFASLGQVNVSERQVRRWIKDGMPHGKRPDEHFARIERDAGLAWLKANRTTITRRGKQKQGGRPKKDGSPPAPAKPREPIPAIEYDHEDPDEAMSIIDHGIPVTIEQLMRRDANDVAKFRYAQDGLLKQLERMALEGTLVKADDVRRSWNRMLDATRRELGKVGRVAVSHYRSVAKIQDEDAATLQKIIDEQIDRALTLIVGSTEEAE
jgi:hypothetical protein